MDRIINFLRGYAFSKFFIPLGIILLVFTVVFFNSVTTRKGYPQTEATVSRVELFEEEHYVDGTKHEATYTVFVKYTINGKQYEEEYGVVHKMDVGDIVKIDYNPDDPRDISQPHTIVLPIVFAAAGIIALAAGVLSAVMTASRNRALRM